MPRYRRGGARAGEGRPGERNEARAKGIAAAAVVAAAVKAAAAAEAAEVVAAAAARVAEYAQCIRRCILCSRERISIRVSGGGSEAGTFFSALTFGTLPREIDI